MLTESSVSFLTGTFPGLLNYRGGHVVLFNVFSVLGEAQVVILHRKYPLATSLVDYSRV